MSDTALSDKKADQLGQKTWKTQDGRSLRWSEMEIKHLRNAAGMLRRNAATLIDQSYAALSYFQGEAALDSAEIEITAAENRGQAMIALAEEIVAYATHRAVKQGAC